MVNLNKIYTKTGDDGKTALVGGQRVSKGDVKIEAYGTVDELNAHLGFIRSEASGSLTENEIALETRDVFLQIQNILFNIGAILASPVDQPYEGRPQVSDEQIQFLEERMDAYQEILAPLTSFVLPGSGRLNSMAHVARTVCRRVERILVRLAEQEAVDENVLKYLNRLSDFLFVYARWVSKHLNEEEPLWEQ
jgi:cob(I)alamin adenosyltransferase